MSASKAVTTIFTSIPTITKALRQSRPDLQLNVVSDPALTGHGGTVNFDPHQLQSTTRDDLAKAEILITEPAVLAAILEKDEDAFPNLKWCQSTYAGVDPIFRLPLSRRPTWTFTRFAGKFGPPMAEWCLARIIAHERSFSASYFDQTERVWSGRRTAVTEYRYLSDLTLAVLGVGDIGLCIAQAAKSFGMKVVGYVRRLQTESEYLDVCTTQLNEAILNADYIVSVLPSTSTTRGLLSGDALKVCSTQGGGKCPVLINVGRGDVIDEPSLIRALDLKYISAAILDVFPVEPLPSTSPLWDREDVVVSPHVSSITRGSDVPDVFLANYELFLKGEPLNHTVDWEKGY